MAEVNGQVRHGEANVKSDGGWKRSTGRLTADLLYVGQPLLEGR
jgi:hypothetical protein